ncbi:hypothetical protein CAEBREN_24317 [Caenorhabditis brenneri]|uniref:Uncharacterized protein n=1 Tax=Caenorhabditis brenneri TaxID=135651 RepID=G0MVM4_CAEBE|nr:hypothetical protein CAEBREN_24317 [Caenorhabditis brenneri]
MYHQSDIKKDSNDVAFSFFRPHQDAHLKRYEVIEEICKFYRHMVKEEHSILGSILGKVVFDLGKDMSTKRLVPILDHLLIEVSTLHKKAVTIRWEKTIEFERILYAFNGLVASLKYEMKADTRTMWEALKEKNIKNPKYISVAEVNDSMAIHLARV